MTDTLATRPIHRLFGVEVPDVQLADVTAEHLYPALRELFERHSVLLFRGQRITPEQHIALARLFGPIEDRSADDVQETAAFTVPQVSNRQADGSISAETDLHTLNLKANQLWHTDSTFLPTPALANLITARVVTSSGGETELCSTRAAFAEMPEALREAARGATLWHRYAHSRAKIAPELTRLDLIARWPDQAWRAVWPNPVTGAEAVYVASHAFRVDGMDDAEGAALIEALVAFCTQPRYVYTHSWQVGDFIIFDERATMHRGRPWPYEEERTLESICVSVTEADGLGAVRPAA